VKLPAEADLKQKLIIYEINELQIEKTVDI
jgi:hypothetical protein